MLLAAYDLGDALLTALAIFFFVIWIWIVVAILIDLFRSDDLSGWAKAVWALAFIVAAPLTALVYLIVRGSGMRERAIQDQVESKNQFDEYVRQTAATSPVDELHKLDQLKQSGGITEDEYQQMKAKILA